MVEFKSKHHTADEISKLVTAALEASGLPKDAVFRAVHDAAKNMVNGVRDADINGLLCTAHQLQRCVVQGMAKTQTLAEKLKKVKVRVIDGVPPCTVPYLAPSKPRVSVAPY